MGARPLYFSAATDAVDASLVTKDVALLEFAAAHHIPLSQIGAIGDSVNDLPFLTIPGLGLSAAPANAQPAVRRALDAAPNAMVTSSSFLEGFAEFYAACEARGLSHVFADKDGVLVWNGDGADRRSRLSAFFSHNDGSRPRIIVITGSSRDQNRDFILDHGVPLVLAENGAVQISQDGRAVVRLEWIDPGLRVLLHREFRRHLMVAMEAHVLPAFSLTWSERREDQNSKIYMPPKETMVTCNIPRRHRGHDDYRQDPESDQLRTAILKQMQGVADHLRVNYRVL